MGFFSSSKTYYNSTSSKLFEEVNGVVKQTVLAAVMQNRNIADDLRVNLANGIGAQAQRFYNYGKGGNYPWGLPEGNTVVMSASSYSNVQLIIEKELGVPISLGFAIVDLNSLTGTMWYYATYYKLDNVGNILPEAYNWEYDESLGTHPLLTLPRTVDASRSPYYPIIPIRVNNESYVGKGKPHNYVIKTAGDLLGLDVKQIAEAIEEQANEPGNDNPVEDAYVMLGVEVATESEEGKEYLYRFFNHRIGADKVLHEDYTYWETNDQESDNKPPPYNRITIEDSNYKMELGWLYITARVVTGNIASVGKHHVTYTLGITEVLGRGEYTFSGDDLIISKQISNNQYREITVKSITHSNWAVGKEIRTTLRDAFEDPDGVGQCFMVPLRVDIVNPMGATKVHDLMYTAIRLVVNDKNKVKLKWYQQGWFQVVLLIVAVVLSVFGQVQLAGAVLSIDLVVMTVVKILIAKIVFSMVMEQLQDLLGEELALVVQLIASYYLGVQSGVGQGAMVAQTGVSAIAGAYSIYGANKLEDIQAELEDLAGLSEEADDYEAEFERSAARVLSLVQGDPYFTLQAATHIRSFHMENKIPTLIREVTHNFTDIMRFTDRPSSYIRLGN